MERILNPGEFAMAKELDDKDLEIIAALSKNARLSEKKIAKKTHIPMTTVHNRMQKLTSGGIITGSTLRLDYAKLGKSITAFVMVKVSPQTDQKDILEYVFRKQQVQEASMITGEFDVIFKARVSNMDELNQLIVQDLRKQRGVSETRTMISYETLEK